MFFLFFVILLGCKEESKMVVNLPMGGELQAFIDDSPVKISSDCMKKLGLCYHEFSRPFSSATLPDVNVKVGSSIVKFEHVVALSIMDNRERTKGKLHDASLTLRGVPSRSQVSVAKPFAYSVIRNILSAGWEYYIYPFDPRIAVSDLRKFKKCSLKAFGQIVMSHPCFNPNYEMSDDQWQTTGFYKWYFFRDGYYLILDAWSSRGDKDPAGQASYLFTVEIKSEQEFWLQDFEGDERSRWRELLPARLRKYRAEREMTEKKAEEAGFEIDRSYRDAPVSVNSD
jgi:hypothetical protein